MRKYKSFPIIINYNLHMQLRNKHKEDDFYFANQPDEEKRVYIETTRTSDETLENNVYRVEVDDYESTVFRCLETIERNAVRANGSGLDQQADGGLDRSRNRCHEEMQLRTDQSPRLRSPKGERGSRSWVW